MNWSLTKLAVSWVNPEDLTLYDRRARRHSPKAEKKMKRSFEVNRFVNPPIIDSQNMVLCGALRVTVAKKMGMALIPVIRIDHMTEAQKRAYIIADNRLAEEGSWDKSILREELSGLIELGYDVELTGFDTIEIDTMLSLDSPEDLEAIEHQLQRMRAGEILQLIVTIPPRHLKSITISAAWVAWMLGREPQTRFNCVSHTKDLAEKHAGDCLKIMDSGWYRKAFPNVRLTKRQVLDFETSAGGGRLSTSIEGGFTGRGGEWVIIDDPHKAEDAFSETMRKAVHDWFFNTARGRANTDQVRFIVVMQRLHEDDLAGHLLRLGGWEELRLASIATHDEKIALTRGRFHYRSEGFPLTPGRQSLAYLRRRESEQPYVFAAQNQQDPIARIGSFVDPAWFGTYDIEPTSGTTIMSCDTANKTTVRSDWSVLIAARFYQGRWYILDVFRARVEFDELKDAVKSLCGRYGVQQLLIEDAASGQSLIQHLRQDMQPHEPYPVGVTPIRDKIQRFEAQASRIKAGQVVLPRTAPWLREFIEEIARFPGGRHDDQADALAQMLASPPPQIMPTITAGPEIVDPYDRRSGLEGYDADDDPWLPSSY